MFLFRRCNYLGNVASHSELFLNLEETEDRNAGKLANSVIFIS